MPIEEVFETYHKRLYGLFLLYNDILRNRCCKLTEPEPSKETNFERLVEGIAIQVALTWEIFAIDILLWSIIEYPNEFKKQFKSSTKDKNWKPKISVEVERMLLGGRGKYISFGNTSTFIKYKAGAFLSRKDKKKNPFLSLNQDLVQELDRFSNLRHYLVHRSSYSENEFKNAFPDSRSPGEYLKRIIEEDERPQKYNQEYELGYFIMIFKSCLYKMANAKSITLPKW